jgi:ATP-binding cassette subfamily B protein
MRIRKPKPIAALVASRRPDGAPLGEEPEPEQRPLDMALVRRLMGYTRPHARLRNWLLVTVLVRSIHLPLAGWVLGQVIQGPIAHGDLRGTLIGAAWFTALALWTAANFHFRARLALVLGEAVIHDLRAAVFAHLQSQTMGFYHRTKLGRIISRMTSDIEAVRVGVQDVLFISMVQVGQMLIAGALMWWCDPVLFGAVLAIAPAIWGINRYFSGALSNAYRETQESFSRITANLAESVNGIRVTQGFVRQDLNAGMFRELVTDHFQVGLGAARLSAVFLPMLELNSQFFIALLLLLGGWRALNPAIAMPVGDLIQFFFLANLFFQPIQSLGMQYNQALTAMAGAERVFKLLDQKPDWQDAPGARPLAPGTAGRVEFRGVRFSYAGGPPVLDDINFVAEPGQTVALVGHTGSGKSSIINLIAKFYLPDAGEILVDGQEISALTSESLHRQMAIVSQANFLFNETVAENVRFARPDATPEELLDVFRRLDCLDLIERLPEGLQTQVGERGGGLSAGQRQLICFARAMLADPRILILDEATSAIDALTEVRLQTALGRLVAGRTSFVVAHRLSTIRHADQVLVLANGRIVERGAHLGLIAQGGVYANLYREFVRGGN